MLPLTVDGGRILNVSSGLARFVTPGKAAYAMMKGGIEVLTSYLAKELGVRGIRVYTLAPGAIAIDFSGGAVRDNPQVNAFVAANTAPEPCRSAGRHRRRRRCAPAARKRLVQWRVHRSVRRHVPLRLPGPSPGSGERPRSMGSPNVLKGAQDDNGSEKQSRPDHRWFEGYRRGNR